MAIWNDIYCDTYQLEALKNRIAIWGWTQSCESGPEEIPRALLKMSPGRSQI